MQASRNLEYESAWGFQTAGCNSLDFYFRLYLQNNTKYNEGIAFAETSRKIDTYSKLKGYAPFYGIYAGRMRIKNVYNNSDAPNKIEHIIRGIAEIIPFVGLLLVIPDLLVTAYRLVRYKAVPLSQEGSPAGSPRGSVDSQQGRR